MGMDINKITNAALRKLALECDKDETKGKLSTQEFIDFTSKAKENEETHKAWTELMGWTTTPTKKGEVQNTKLPEDNLKHYQKKEFKNAIEKAANFEALEKDLTERFTSSDYKEALEVVSTLVNEIKTMGISSKDDVEAIKDTIKDKYQNCNGLNNDIINRLVDIAKREQIEREKQDLMQLYYTVKEEQGENANFTDCKNAVKKMMEDLELKGKSYYSDEAFKALEGEIKYEANLYLDDNLRNTYGATDRTEGSTKGAVKKELLKEAKDDNILRSVIKKDKTDNKLEARYNKAREIGEEIANISEDELKKELGGKLVDKLRGKNFIKPENGHYNLTNLQEVLIEYVGNDLMLNRSTQTEVTELKNLQDKLYELTGAEFSISEIKDLVKFTGLKYEKRDRSWKTLLGATAIGAGSGALGAGMNQRNLNVTQKVNIKIGANYAGVILEQLDSAATSSQNSDGTITISVLQNVIKNADLSKILAGAGVGALIGALGGLVIGEDKQFEPACISLSAITDIVNNAKSLEEAQEALNKKYPDSRGTLLSAIAQAISEENTGDWKMKFLAELTKIGGKGSIINCEELSGNKFVTEEVKDNTEETVEEPKKEDNFFATKDVEAKEAEYETNFVPTVDGRCSSWQKLAEQYECIKDLEIPAEYKNCNRKKSQLTVRMLKVAQAITDGDYSLDRMLKLAEASFASRNSKYENMKNIEGIDYNVLVATMNAELMSNKVKMPEYLAGCERQEKSICDDSITDKTGKRAGVASAVDTRKISDGQEAKYYARFNNGAVQEFSNENDRNTAVENFKKENENARRIDW